MKEGPADIRPAEGGAATRGIAALADAEQRALIRTALETTLLVEAAAGTGKTTALVGRIVEVLAAGRAQLDRIIAVTFTEAAAGELKLRLRAAIEKARQDGARPAREREHLRAALPRLEEARVGTIHGFCMDLLREHPIEAGIDPFFEVAAEDVARGLFERAFDAWFERQLAAPGPAVRRILRRRKREFRPGALRGEEGPRAVLRRSAWQLIEHRDFPAPWRALPGFARDAHIDALCAELQALAAWAPRADPNDWFGKSLREIEKAAQELERAERVRPRDHDGLEGWLGDLAGARHWDWKGWKRASTPEFPLEELRQRRDALHARLRQFVDDAGADLAPRLRDELWPVVEDYQAAKERVGCLDFTDLLIHARNLIRDDRRVRGDVQQQFTHYFVDEFQDTDPLQAEILLLLAADDPDLSDWRTARVVPGKLFLVGDPKQSIYRFRRADVELYRAVQRRLLEQGAVAVPLSVSFRSVPEIQEAVNAVFAQPFAASQGGYVPLAPFRERHAGQPAVIALPLPEPYGPYDKITQGKLEQSLPDVVAAWISWLIEESGWTVTERENPHARVKVEPRHVCLLFKRLKVFGEDATRPYVDALEARELPHLVVGGSAFHSREEIETLAIALTAIERPDDELAVFATLRGPLLALSDAALLLWREQVGPLNPFRPPPADLPPSLTEVAQSLQLLKTLHLGRNRWPVADTIARLLEATRAHAAFAIWPTGMQALANLGRLMDLARRAERQGLVSFRSFVEHLEMQAERGEVAEAPLLEEGVQGVRMMTAHKAKGLEFPVVILVDMTAPEVHRQPTRWSDPQRGVCVQSLAGCMPPELREHAAEELEREREEALRLLYVAATRARDVLVVPVIGDEQRPGWLSALHPAVYPAPSRARRPASRQVPGAAEFGSESVLKRPDKVLPPEESVSPGVHAAQAGSHQVAWWDPARLQLGLAPSMGLAQMRILQQDEAGRSDEGHTRWQAWRSERAKALARGEHPSRQVQSAVERARGPQEIRGASDVTIIDARWSGARPGGARFGTLVHALLATVELNADRPRVASQAQIQARLLGASQVELAAATEVAVAALAHPLLRRAAESAARGLCRREVGLVVKLDEDALLECVADLAFRDEGGWTVVDFKTDAELNGREEVYRRQVALYVRGIAEASSIATRGHVLLV